MAQQVEEAERAHVLIAESGLLIRRGDVIAIDAATAAQSVLVMARQ